MKFLAPQKAPKSGRVLNLSSFRSVSSMAPLLVLAAFRFRLFRPLLACYTTALSFSISLAIALQHLIILHNALSFLVGYQPAHIRTLDNFSFVWFLGYSPTHVCSLAIILGTRLVHPVCLALRSLPASSPPYRIPYCWSHIALTSTHTVLRHSYHL